MLLVTIAGCAGKPLGDGFALAPERVLLEIDERLAHKDPLVILDARPRAQFEAGRLPGARWVDLAAWTKLSRAPGSGLYDLDGWRQRIAALGITANDAVLVYDGGEMVEAARLWFMLRHAGVARVALVDGGFPVLPKERLERGAAESPMPCEFAAPREFVAPVRLVDKAVLRDAPTEQIQILDARTAGEYTGVDARGNSRTGRLPGAVNLPHARLLDERGRLQSVENTRKLLAQAGLNLERPIATYCQSGGRAALAAFAAARAGARDVRNYYMSFAEWAADERCPLEHD